MKTMEKCAGGAGCRGAELAFRLEVYATRPDKRARWLRLWDDRVRPILVHAGAGRVVGEYLSYRDDRIVVVLRAFEGGAERDRALAEAADRPDWIRARRALSELVEGREVRSLVPVEGSGLRTRADLERPFSGVRAQDPSGPVELRRYRLAPGRRKTFAGFFARRTLRLQESVGMRVPAFFADEEDEDRFVWLRSFPDLEERDHRKRRFYGGRAWVEELEGPAMELIDDYSDVDLLFPRPGAVLR